MSNVIKFPTTPSDEGLGVVVERHMLEVYLSMTENMIEEMLRIHTDYITTGEEDDLNLLVHNLETSLDIIKSKLTTKDNDHE